MAKQVQPSLESFLQAGDTPQPRPDEVAKTFKRRSVNIDLQKSIQLLDDAVSPSVNRPVRTPRSGYRHVNYTPNRLDSRFNTSVKDVFVFTPAKTKEGDELRTQNISPVLPILTTTQNMEFTTGIDMTEDLTQSNLTFLADGDPGLKASSGLYEDFMSAMKRCPAPHQVMDLLSCYEMSCSELVTKLKKLQKGVTRNQPKLKRTVTTLGLLRGELETWQLVKSLYKDRLETEAKDDDMNSNDEGLLTKVWSLSEQNITSHLYEKDRLVRQSQLVIDWLEMCAAENLDTWAENVKMFVDQPVSWENSLHHLQKMKQGLRATTERPTISEMDPDAPHRQRKPLDDLDKEDERLLLKCLFWCLRAGQLDKAQELCHICGQPWRAASLEGWRLLHDPNYYSYSSAGDGKQSSVEGNAYRDVWKSVCWRMASETELDKYERALYAALSGNLESLLPVCVSWMDFLWAYYKVMVDIKVEQEIRLHRHVTRTLDSMPPEFWDKMLEPQEIFKEIGASVDEAVRQESEHWYHLIQKFVILGDVPALINVMHSWLQNRKDYLPQHLLRLMVHIVLFLKSIGHVSKEDLCEAIIEAYVADLIKSKRKSLVAHYVATLRAPAQVQWYASFLEGVEETEERQQCLVWAEEEGLDVAAITKAVVERVRDRETTALPPENSLAPDVTVTAEDRAKIDAIDWLVFDESHRSEAMKQANAIMRAFIAVKKHLAARQAFEKLPTDSIDVIYRQWHLQTGTGELPVEDSNAIREYMCMKAYLDAVESFNDWFSLYHQGRPAKPSVGSEGVASFTDRVALEHKMKQYQMEMERWRHSLRQQTRVTKDRIYNVLLFADGGWLVDAEEETDMDEVRQRQMSQLRKLHLPALCLNLHNVLHSSEMYADAVQIADVIASEHHQLYQDFDTESLQHLLGQISRSSRCLLDENKDPLGYEVV
ncbi:nuclear pore complex protein Nup107 [Aplysia californica]|uniref:Nuclear pore complex protein n=1 Tax=Aplysia californica TaxID=6500 RepID=A0ABM0JPD7_APLCA|nr:nuclear pore complex protein Nup107 [Aplysia californica]